MSEKALVRTQDRMRSAEEITQARISRSLCSNANGKPSALCGGGGIETGFFQSAAQFLFSPLLVLVSQGQKPGGTRVTSNHDKEAHGGSDSIA